MCGIIGVSGIPDAARLTYLGLYALQHRGQESAGIVVVDRDGMARAHRGMGLVSENFDEPILSRLPGDVAVGHTRYSTTGSTVLANAQPCSVNTRCGTLAIAQTLIILTAGIDLSVGAVMILSSMVVAQLAVNNGLPAPVALLAGLVVAVTLLAYLVYAMLRPEKF